MATQIGVIKALIGEVKATAADGSTRTLQLGDMVYANELITTGPGGAVEIEFADGSIMDLGRSSQAMLDEAVFDPTATAVADASSEDVPDDVAAIQQALLEGEDPTEIGEATAAGAGVTGTGNEGHEPVFVDYLNPEVTPDAGFDTIGVSNEYDLPEEDIIILEEEDEPVVPVVSVSVDVEIEIDEQEPPQTEPPTDGVPTPDYPVLVEGNAASVLEGTSEGTKQVVFIINLSEAFDQDVQVTYQLRPVSTNGAADNPDDWFDGPSIQTVTILAGDTSFPVEVSIVEDHLDEGNGTFEIVLLSANNATINPDADSATVTIYDDDTTPVAQDDLNTVFEDNAGQPYDGDPSTSGNVISGIHDATGDTPDVQEDTDEDGDVLEIVSFSDADENVPAGGTITGEYGELTLNSDGSYTYVLTTNDSDVIQGLSEGEFLSDVFSYVVTDTYNAEQTAELTIVIEGTDDGVIIRGLDGEGAEEAVYEANLADGSDPDAPALTQDGSFDFDAPDGIGDTGSVSIGGQSFSLAQLQALGGANVDIPSSYGVLTLTGYTGDAFGGSISYEYTLNDNVDNDSQAGATDGSFTDSFEVIVTDNDGSDATASLDVEIIDDTPTANDDGPEAVTEDGTSVVSGNVLDNDDANADQVAAFVGWGDDQDNVDAIAALNTYGTLVQNGDGSWSYTLDNTDPDTQALDSSFSEDYVLTYTMADADGDEAPASLTITINGADDNASVVTAAAQGPDATVYEAGLNPDGSDAGSDSETTTGSFTVSATDGILNVVIGGTTFTLVEVQAFDGTQTVSTGEGTLTLTDYTGDAMSGTINYSYTLDATIDNDSVVASGDDAVTLAHFDDSTEITVNGVGGSTASDDLVIRAIDDTPTANDDGPVATAEDTAVDVTVDVNDVAGADGVDFTDGTKVFVSTAASNGSVIYNDDGTFTYTPDAGFEGQDTFVYTITDNDGDTDTATVTITVGPDSEPVVSVSDAAVDETGGLDSVDGTLSADFGNDTGAIALSATGATWSAGTNTLTANDGSWKVVNNQNGTYTFTQLAAMSHLGGEDASLDIVVTVTATDSDGDVDNTNTITVTVYDDGPVVTDYDGVINTDAASGLEVLDYDLGLDGLGSVSFSLAGSSVPLTSGGQAVLTESIDLGDGREQLVGYLESGDNAGYQEGEDGVVFSIAPQSPDADPTDGTYELTLSSDNVLDLPQTTVSVSFSGISASGPIDSIDTTGGEITISVISGREGPDDVNANSNYVGINNNGMDDGESIQYLFNTTLVNDLQLDIFNTGGAGETVTWTTWNSADKAGTIDDGSIIITGDGLSVPITADDDFDVIQITVTGGSFKVGGVTYTDTGDPQDVLVQFDYQGQDSDGDAVNGSVDVTVTGIDATTQTSSDLLSHPDSQVDPS